MPPVYTPGTITKSDVDAQRQTYIGNKNPAVAMHNLLIKRVNSVFKINAVNSDGTLSVENLTNGGYDTVDTGIGDRALLHYDVGGIVAVHSDNRVRSYTPPKVVSDVSI